MKAIYKRYCKFLTLKDDPEIIRQYREAHGINKIWSVITQGMKEVGIIDMEIYIHGNILFMIMDTKVDFDHEKAMTELALKPGQKEWEAYVSRYQNTSTDISAGAKWMLMERIYEMDQAKDFTATGGQEKKIRVK